MEVIEWIVRGCLSDKIRRAGIKERVVPVQNTLETLTIDVLGPNNLHDLAVTERSIVTPGPVKQLVAFHTNREKLGYVLVIEQAVAEISNARPRTARDDLLKGIERIKGTRRHANFRSGRGTRRGDPARQRMIGRDEEGKLARGLEIARGAWCEFIMRLCFDIKKVAVNLQLIVADLIIERRITTPAFLCRK